MKRRLVIGVAITLVAIVLPAAPALGWANGEFQGGYGAHDWVLDQANRLVVQGQGSSWLLVNEARPMTDDPDYVYRDFVHHHYDVWGTPYGDADTYVAGLYTKVRDYLTQNKLIDASRTFGLLAHYFADINQPMHTDASSAETDARHTLYELGVDSRTRSATTNQAWVVPDGLAYIADPRTTTVAAAEAAHVDYTTLVNTYARYGFNTTVLNITKARLNRAANDLADIIATLGLSIPR